MAGRRDGQPARAPGSRTANGGPAYGAIDLGTNNCRLLVAVPDEVRGQDDFETFSADLRFDYDAAAGSSCQDLMTAGGFAVGLPCAVVYDGLGARIE